MSFWRRVKDRLSGAEPDEQEAPARPVPLSPPTDNERRDEAARVARARQLASMDDEDLAHELKQVRGSAQEHEVLSHALAVPLGDRARLEVARILVERGEPSRAVDVLTRAASSESLMLLAELHAELGAYPRALATIERVLARSIEAPGAIERHALWSGLAGIDRRRLTTRREEATVATATAESATFRVLREVARGGAGTVYEAVDDTLTRTVAFKVFHGRGDDAAALRVEAEVAVLLGSRFAVRVFDASPKEGWLAMEWAQLGSLRDWAPRAERAHATLWIAPLADAVAALHAHGLVHGDLKPGNILLREVDEPVLTDFGVARRVGEPQAGGSAAFMSPDRIAGNPVAWQDDLYGFGRILEDVREGRVKFGEGEDWEPVLPLIRDCLGGHIPDARILSTETRRLRFVKN